MLASVSAFCASPKPLDGETRVSAADAEKLLTELPAFKNQKALRGKILAETEDLLGTRKSQGELLIDPPGRVLRNFTKPTPSVWLLNGTLLQEYLPARKTVLMTDFSAAPKSLKRIQCAFTGDLNGLSDLFDITVFAKGEGAAREYRFVLLPAAAGSGFSYKRIEARLMAGALFFHQITSEPDSGNTVVESYSEIEIVGKPDATEFELKLPDDVTRKVDKVSDN
jgi:outer membrane lipoprotein-sorting protein